MQTKILDPFENCKRNTRTEPKSAKPTGRSLDALLECVVTKASLLSAVERMFWNGSDAVKLSIPPGEGRHSNKYEKPCKTTYFSAFTSKANKGSPPGKMGSHFKD